MKIIVFLLLVAILAGCTPQAPYVNPRFLSEKDLCTRAHCSYVQALFHENPGVVESAMKCLVRLKMDNPKINCERELKQIDYLAVNGMTPSIRYRAFLTGMYMRHSDMIPKQDKYQQMRNDDEFFISLSTDLNSHILAMRAPQ